MAKNKNKGKFEIPNPLNDLNKLDTSKKYLFGEAANRLNEIKQHRPVFAFDYISLNNSDFCFNSSLLNGQKDYHKLFQSFKNISNKSYDELSSNYAYHFHEVNFDDVSISQSDFLKCLVPDVSKINPDHSPTVYQFKAFEEARVLGFVSKMVFYLVFFDRNHKAYKRK
jgi:hypothetical protein